MRPLLFVSLGAASLVLASGCVPDAAVGGLAARASYLPRTGPPLAAFFDDEDEIPRLIRPPKLPPPPEAREVLPAPRAPRAKYRLGVRARGLRSGQAERNWEDALSYGVFLKRVPLERGKVSLEFGAEYAAVETTDGLVSSTMYVLRADLLLGKFGGKGATPYFFLGGHGIIEEGTRNATGERVTGQGGGADVGVGLGARSGRWDIRAAYSLLFASENTDSNLAVSLGFAF
jgi:hypothetical protein